MAGRGLLEDTGDDSRKPLRVGVCRSGNTLASGSGCSHQGYPGLTGIIQDEIALGVTLQQINLKQIVHDALIVGFAIGFEDQAWYCYRGRNGRHEVGSRLCPSSCISVPRARSMAELGSDVKHSCVTAAGLVPCPLAQGDGKSSPPISE